MGRWGAQVTVVPRWVGGAADGPKEGVWEHTGVATAEGMFDREGMISGVFHGLGHCTLRQVRELRWNGLKEDN